MLLLLGIVAWIAGAIFALRGARWAYAIFILLGFVWIPASAGFHLHWPDCELRFGFDLAVYSLTNYKHVVLFGVFFLMTRVQLGRRPHALLLAFIATLAMGALIELEEGMTAGHCRSRDLIPDATGAAIGAVVAEVWDRRSARRS
ncbi:MAG TPA: hypothetical protein VJ032_00970 [Thermoanaerobaculia bacterium]|nr:hypothetical protein [Thermoanaerobaculia bacterium]